MRKKIVTVTTGTRADYGILRPLLKRINRSKNLELFLIVTGSHLSKNHGNTIQEIIKDGFNINTKINIVPKKDDSLNTSIAIGESIIKFSRYFNKIKPDFNIVFGDRYEMLSSTIAAYNQNILNVHIHGGDKSGGLDEYTRHAITKMSNIHFPATVKSATRIKKMGENPNYIIKSGSLSIDEIIEKKISTLRELNLKYNLDLTGNEIIILQHPDTTEPNKSKEQIVATLKAVIKTKHNAIIIGPNMDTGNNSINKTIKLFSKNNSLKFFSSLPREDYLGLLKNCKLLIGNSSSGIIESTIFKIPVINIGDRQKGREHGPNVINVKKFSQKLISKSLEKSLLMNKSNLRIKNIYGNGRTPINSSATGSVTNFR